MHRFAAAATLLCLWAWSAAPAQEGSQRLLILHTNDLHDHVRAGGDGIGGLPWVSGHVAAVRSARDDVLLLDAGDAAHKGDLVAFLTNSEITFEAMGRMGYDAIAVGNHEHNFGLNQLRVFNALTGERMLALNMVTADGQLLFAPSRVVEVNGIRVGIVGLALPRNRDTLDFQATGKALGAHAHMLRTQAEADIVVALCHVGVEDATLWSRMAPQVDVFVTGHTHQALHGALVVAETGALIVQAGANARYVGHLELELSDARRPIAHNAHLVEMSHARVAPDQAMVDWVRAREAQLAPDADRVVTRLDRPIGWFAIARLGAAALRSHGEADIGLYHPTHVVRNVLVPGEVSVNALFRTSADRGHPLVRTQLSGAQITAYLGALGRREPRAWGQTQWAGFSVSWGNKTNVGRGAGDPHTDLDPDRRYSVIMTAREWENRFLPLVDRLEGEERIGPLSSGEFHASPAGFSSIEALSAYLDALGDTSVNEHLADLATAQGDSDPLEAQAEQRILQRALPTQREITRPDPARQTRPKQQHVRE